MRSADTIPVLIGVGEVIDRPTTPEAGLEPLDLMRAALLAADADAGGGFLARVDMLSVINEISWPYAAPAQELAARLGLHHARATYGVVGGETPLRFLEEAANAIATGRARVAAICGGEAHRTVAQAARSGVDLPWTPKPTQAAPSIRGQDTADPVAKALGVHLPITVYPFYENAQTHAWRQSPAEALDETASLWSGMSEVAAANPMAWVRTPHSAAEIRAISPANRAIAFPYSKLVVANINVNQGAAFLVTSLARARAAGLDDGRLVFLNASASAAEHANYLVRDRYSACQARDVVLDAALRVSPDGGFDAVELYSCFPCVPKAARRALGLAADAPVTVAGGLSFFGAPLNNYMSHAVCAMVRKLRDGAGEGLLYGQGGFATKHHMLVLGVRPKGDSVEIGVDLNPEVARRYGGVPTWQPDAVGEATIETYTVISDRDGLRHGAIVARTKDGARTLARVTSEDEAGLRVLEAFDVSPIGQSGYLERTSDTVSRWRFQ